MPACPPLHSLLLVLLVAGPGQPARILGLFPYKGASHFYVFRPLLEELAVRGHSVDVVSHVPREVPLVNYTDIPVVNEDDPPLEFVDFQVFEEMETTFYSNLVGLQFLTLGYDYALSRPQVRALVNTSYDLVIMEMFNSDVFYGLVHRIGAPVIGFSSCQLMPWFADYLGAPNDLAYIPNMPGGHGITMGFFERFLNFLEVWASRAFYRFIIHPEAQATAEKHLGPLPDLAEIATNTSLLFVNSHFSLFGLRPLPPSVIEVGGINVREPRPLPTDLQKMIDNSKGVIYFSMGSALKAASLPKEKRAMFINAFKSTGKTILWKREEPLAPEEQNIVTRPWFPQRDILAHPKVELFVAHCGLLGLHEAVVSGVPLICIPMYGDQPSNAKSAEEQGISLTLRYATLTEAQITSAIHRVLHDKKFKKRAEEVSRAFKARPLPPLDTAVFWTEYLLKHGPGVFDGPFKRMSVWERAGFDVAALLLLLLLACLTLVVLLLRLVLGSWRKEEKLKKS